MRRSVFYIFIFACFVLILTCRKDPDNPKEQKIPEIITDEISILEAGVFKTYLVNAKIINEGSDPVTSLGVCWNTNKNPTILDNKVSEDSGNGPPAVSRGKDGEFFSHINGDKLKPVTTYYVRAYATNTAGTAYGNELSFTTPCYLGNVVPDESIKVELKNPANGISNQYTSQYLRWSLYPDVPTDIAYEVYLSTRPDPDSLVAQTRYNSYQIDNLRLNTTYYWKIIGRTACQEVKSSVFGFTTVKELFPPTVVTRSNVITSTKYAIVSWEIVSDGGSPITENGYYYGEAPDPEKTGTKISSNFGSPRIFSAILSANLKPEVSYFFKAFAANILGRSYGEQVEFKIKSPVNPITDLEGNIYSSITLGSQQWMADNLNSTKFNDGTPIPSLWQPSSSYNDSTPSFCEYGNNSSNLIYGRLYNWHAVKTGKLCPSGWHVPSKDEWMILENYLIANGYNFDGTLTENKIAKSMAIPGLWNSNRIPGSPGADDYPEYINKSGFSSVPSGARICYHLGSDFASIFDYGQGETGNWWSSTEYIDPSFNPYYKAWYYNISANGVGTQFRIDYKRNGFSVRCVKD